MPQKVLLLFHSGLNVCYWKKFICVETVRWITRLRDMEMTSCHREEAPNKNIIWNSVMHFLASVLTRLLINRLRMSYTRLLLRVIALTHISDFANGWNLHSWMTVRLSNYSRTHLLPLINEKSTIFSSGIPLYTELGRNNWFCHVFFSSISEFRNPFTAM